MSERERSRARRDSLLIALARASSAAIVPPPTISARQSFSSLMPKALPVCISEGIWKVLPSRF